MRYLEKHSFFDYFNIFTYKVKKELYALGNISHFNKIIYQDCVIQNIS